MIIFLSFKSQHEIDVIIITYFAVICLDLIIPQSVREDQGNLLISGENQEINETNSKPAG